jgi:hypothetical protein
LVGGAPDAAFSGLYPAMPDLYLAELAAPSTRLMDVAYACLVPITLPRPETSLHGHLPLRLILEIDIGEWLAGAVLREITSKP